MIARGFGKEKTMATTRRMCLATAGCLMIVAGVASAQGRGAPHNAPPPDIAGQWTGTWSAYNPAQGATPPKEQCAKLDATVVAQNGTWLATFEGDCGRPYKYSIKMEGRAAGRAVLFQGTADLGAKDGGVYDWIGRATATEFIGFYTNAFTTGVFSLSRAK
jgi:hypothetical protein